MTVVWRGIVVWETDCFVVPPKAGFLAMTVAMIKTIEYDAGDQGCN